MEMSRRDHDPIRLEEELKQKSKLLEQTIHQFTEATCEIGELEKQLAFYKIDGNTSVASDYGFSRSRNDDSTINRNNRTPSIMQHIGYGGSEHGAGLQPDDLSWEVEESQVDEMRLELGVLVREESMLNIRHLQAKDDLQESWDKLLKLRTHISFFYAAIEEAKIEEIALDAQGWSTISALTSQTGQLYDLQIQPECLNATVAPATAEDFVQLSKTPMKDSVQQVDRFVGIYVLREKVQKRDIMRKAVADSEKALILARDKVANYSDELLAISSASAISGGGSFSSNRGMGLRQKLLEANLELESVENMYLKNKDGLAQFEAELGTALLGVSESVITELKGTATDGGESSLNVSHLLGFTGGPEDGISVVTENSSNASLRPSTAYELSGRNIYRPEPQSIRTFSLEEVLSGQIRISRMNGESAGSYRERLQRRVHAIEPLVVQLKLEVETKAEKARAARLDLKDAEVKRLRAELQIANCENIIKQKKEEKQRLMDINIHQEQVINGPKESPLNLRTPASHNKGGVTMWDRARTEEKVYNRFYNQINGVDAFQYHEEVTKSSERRGRSDNPYSRRRSVNKSKNMVVSASPAGSNSPMRFEELISRGEGSQSDGEARVSPSRASEKTSRKQSPIKGTYASSFFVKPINREEDEGGHTEVSEGTGVSRKRYSKTGLAHRLSSPHSGKKAKQTKSVLRTASTGKLKLHASKGVVFASPPNGRRQINPANATGASRPVVGDASPSKLHEPSTSWPGSSNYSYTPETPSSDQKENTTEHKYAAHQRSGKAKPRARSASAESRSSKEHRQALLDAMDVLNSSLEKDDAGDALRAAELISNEVSNELHTGTNVGSQRRFRSSRKLRANRSEGEDDANDKISLQKKNRRSKSVDAARERENVRSDGYSSLGDENEEHEWPQSHFASPGLHSVSTIGNSSRASYQVHNYADSPNHKYTASAIKRRTSADESMCRIIDMLNKNQESLDMLNSTQTMLKNMLISPPHASGESVRSRHSLKDNAEDLDIPKSIYVPTSPPPGASHTENVLNDVSGQSILIQHHPKGDLMTEKAPLSKKKGGKGNVDAKPRAQRSQNLLSSTKKTMSTKSTKEAELGSPFLKKGVTTPIIRGRISNSPSRVQLARKIASVYGRSRSRSRGVSPGRNGTRSKSVGAESGRDSGGNGGDKLWCSSPGRLGKALKSIDDLDIPKVPPEPFEFDRRPKPFHRTQERFDHHGSPLSGDSKSLDSRFSPRASENFDRTSDSIKSDHNNGADGLQAPVLKMPAAMASPDSVSSKKQSESEDRDVVKEYLEKQQILKKILSTGTQVDDDVMTESPDKRRNDPEMTSIGVDTSGLSIREAGWLWSPNSKGKDRATREQEMNERIDFYRRNRKSLSPSRSPSPSKVSAILNRDKKQKDKDAKDGVTRGRKPSMVVSNNSKNIGTSIAVTASNIKSHIQIEQKKLEKCIIKLTNLKDNRDKMKSRLDELKRKKRLERQQSSDGGNPFLASNESVSEKNNVTLRIVILTARNLPEMKRRTHSADPFVECWVKAPESLSASNDGINETHTIDGVQMNRYCTTVKWGMLFPLWEETFDFAIPCNADSEGHHSGVIISDDCLRIVLRDAVKADMASTEASNIQSMIGECFLNFSSLLDQKTHTIWLPVIDTVVATPELHHLARSRHKIPSDCALKIEARLLYSKELLLRNKIAESDKQISKLSEFVDACTNELLDLAYEWEKMQQKQNRLNELTKKKKKSLDDKPQHQYESSTRVSVQDSFATQRKSLSFDAFMATTKPTSVDNFPSTSDLPNGSILEAGNSPIVRLEQRDGEDFLLLARSNIKPPRPVDHSPQERILHVSECGFVSARSPSMSDKSILLNAVTDAKNETSGVMGNGFLENIDDHTSKKQIEIGFPSVTRPKSHSQDENKDVFEVQTATDAPAKAPNMSIFHGAGGGRNPPTREKFDKRQKHDHNERRWK